jgi:hypothetical protein
MEAGGLFDHEHKCDRMVLTVDRWAETANAANMVIKTEDGNRPGLHIAPRR